MCEFLFAHKYDLIFDFALKCGHRSALFGLSCCRMRFCTVCLFVDCLLSSVRLSVHPLLGPTKGEEKAQPTWHFYTGAVISRRMQKLFQETHKRIKIALITLSVFKLKQHWFDTIASLKFVFAEMTQIHHNPLPPLQTGNCLISAAL